MELKRSIATLALLGGLLPAGCVRNTPPPLSPEAQAVVLVTSSPAQAMLLARVCEPAGVVDGPNQNALRERAASGGQQVVEVLYNDPNARKKSRTTAVLHHCDPSIDIETWLADLD